MGNALSINTCGQREGSKLGQGEKLGILELGWTFRDLVARGPDLYMSIPVFLSFTCKLP